MTPPLAAQVRALLGTRRFGRPLRSFASVPSTNTVAMEWAAQAAAEGSTVVAEYQTAGRGRMGRTWDAAPGQNLLFSVVLRPQLAPEKISLVTLAASIAVAEAVDAVTSPLNTTIKWPNDILLEGRKCCGMLLESITGAADDRTVILGVGLNVNQRDFGAGLDERATSLLLQTGRQISRATLLADILLRMEWYNDLLHSDPRGLRAAYGARLDGIGQRATVTWSLPAGRTSGIIQGITETGALRLRTENGTKICHAGEVASHRRKA